VASDTGAARARTTSALPGNSGIAPGRSRSSDPRYLDARQILRRFGTSARGGDCRDKAIRMTRTGLDVWLRCIGRQCTPTFFGTRATILLLFVDTRRRDAE
jgi:hypothetical protein